MEIKIKKIGYKVGTVGWLAKGIEDGSIKIVEGITKLDNKHGLWMKHSPKETNGKKVYESMILAVFNPYDLSPRDFDGAHSFVIAPQEGDMWCPGDDIGCTNACWDTITEITQAWIDHVTEERANDKKTKITIKFEEEV